MQTTKNLIELRQLLAERFPQTRLGLRAAEPIETVATGVPRLDELLGGGLPRGKCTELIGAGTGSGSAQIIHALLRRVAVEGQFLALVDGTDSFDAGATDSKVLAHLLWIRCAKAEESLKATDLLLRDRNISLVVLDLKLNPPAQLKKIPSGTWFRFSRLQEENGATLLAVTPFQMVSGASCRMRVKSELGLETLTDPPDEVQRRLRFELLRSVLAGEEDTAAQAG